MRKIFLSLLIVLLLFSSCSSDNPSPSGEDVNPPAAADESTLVQKTTEGKYIVETTLQSLSGKIQEAIRNNETEVDLVPDGVPVLLDNKVTITKGKILINPPDAAARAADSSYSFSVIIEEAVTGDNEPIKLEYESNIQLNETGSIKKIEPVKTEAKIGGASVSDIDSDTFIPVALAFFNEDLLNSLSQMMKDIAASEAFSKFGISLEQMTIRTSIGKVDVDCAKSALLSNGTGVLVFKLVELDNQWHTASSAGGVITIDGWADVKEGEGTIEIAENPEVKDENSGISAAEELDIVNSFVPRFYTLQVISSSTLFTNPESDSSPAITATGEELKIISEIASIVFEQETTVSSYVFKQNDVMIEMNEDINSSNVSRENPGIFEVYANISGYGEVEMIVHVYAESNSASDNKIVSFKVGNNDYSYLSNDILKSMLRVFTGTAYITDGSNIILGSVLSAGDIFVDNKYTHQFDGTGEYYSQFTFQGSVDISLTEINGEGDVSGSYSFKNVIVNDSVGDVTYNISGTGSFSTVRIEKENMPNPVILFDGFTLDSYSVSGIGNISAGDLEVININFEQMLKSIISMYN